MELCEQCWSWYWLVEVPQPPLEAAVYKLGTPRRRALPTACWIGRCKRDSLALVTIRREGGETPPPKHVPRMSDALVWAGEKQQEMAEVERLRLRMHLAPARHRKLTCSQCTVFCGSGVPPYPAQKDHLQRSLFAAPDGRSGPAHMGFCFQDQYWTQYGGGWTAHPVRRPSHQAHSAVRSLSSLSVAEGHRGYHGGSKRTQQDQER